MQITGLQIIKCVSMKKFELELNFQNYNLKIFKKSNIVMETASRAASRAESKKQRP